MSNEAILNMTHPDIVKVEQTGYLVDYFPCDAEEADIVGWCNLCTEPIERKEKYWGPIGAEQYLICRTCITDYENN